MLAITFGRFQGLHNGHKAIFNKLDCFQQASIWVSPSEGTAKNPISRRIRINMIKKIANQQFVDGASPYQALEEQINIGNDDLLIICGEDRAKDYLRMIASLETKYKCNLDVSILQRSCESATKVRQACVEENYTEYQRLTNRLPIKLRLGQYSLLKNELCKY